MDMSQMAGAEAYPAPSGDRQPSAPSAPPEEAISAAIVQATSARMSLMKQQMRQMGHTPQGM